MRRRKGDPEPRPRHRFTPAERLDPLAKRRVGRQGEVEPLAEAIGVESHELGPGVDDGSAG